MVKETKWKTQPPIFSEYTHFLIDLQKLHHLRDLIMLCSMKFLKARARAHLRSIPHFFMSCACFWDHVIYNHRKHSSMVQSPTSKYSQETYFFTITQQEKKKLIFLAFTLKHEMNSLDQCFHLSKTPLPSTFLGSHPQMYSPYIFSTTLLNNVSSSPNLH